jgi:hypothetical protein
VTAAHLATEAAYREHTEQRATTLSQRNHAGQTIATCVVCGTVFDVGAERAQHPTFRPYCTPECFAAPHQRDRTDGITTWCRCGWFTTIWARRFPGHRERTAAA